MILNDTRVLMNELTCNKLFAPLSLYADNKRYGLQRRRCWCTNRCTSHITRKRKCPWSTRPYNITFHNIAFIAMSKSARTARPRQAVWTSHSTASGSEVAGADQANLA